MGVRKHNFNGDYWKLNKTLLQNKEFQRETQKLIDKYWRQAKVFNSSAQYWELMKYEVRNLAILMSKKITRTKKERELQMVTKIISLSSK